MTQLRYTDPARTTPIPWLLMATWLCLALFATAPSRAQGPASGDPAAVQDNPLASGQSQLANRFKKLEGILLRSAEIEAATNPTRAKLMEQAAELAKQVQLSESLIRAARSLESKQYSQAIDDQKTSLENLNKILELLQSENRSDRVREQRDQIRRTIEETAQLLRLQSSLRGRTEGGSQTEKAASDQQKLAEKASKIAGDLSPESKDSQKAGDKSGSDKESQSKPNDSSGKDGQSDKDKDGKDKDSKDKEGKDKEGKDGADKNKDGTNKDGKNTDGKNNDDKNGGDKNKDGEQSKEQSGKQGDNKSSKPNEGEQSPAESSPQKSPAGQSQPQKPNDAQPSDAQPSESGDNSQSQPSGDQQSGEQSESNQPQPPKSPTDRAAERLKQARQNMQEAQKKLEKAEREGAVEKQRQAEQELKKTIEELEEILRQLREEEIERSLAALEERLRLMLQLQNKVLDETKRLQEVAKGSSDRQVEIRASSLAADEKKIVGEAQRALLLLREEGTSAAFPESLTHIISDMQGVQERLSKADVGKLTVNIEEDIVTSLEELVAAMSEIKKENKERKENQMQAPGQQGGQQGEQPLVNQLAEMRLIKTLQLRINKRTQSLSELLKNPNDVIGQAEEADIQGQLRELADRQSSIKQVTRDIVIGKNQQ